MAQWASVFSVSITFSIAGHQEAVNQEQFDRFSTFIRFETRSTALRHLSLAPPPKKTMKLEEKREKGKKSLRVLLLRASTLHQRVVTYLIIGGGTPPTKLSLLSQQSEALNNVLWHPNCFILLHHYTFVIPKSIMTLSGTTINRIIHCAPFNFFDELKHWNF